jgi:hypothetical protein
VILTRISLRIQIAVAIVLPVVSRALRPVVVSVVKEEIVVAANAVSVVKEEIVVAAVAVNAGAAVARVAAVQVEQAAADVQAEAALAEDAKHNFNCLKYFNKNCNNVTTEKIKTS